MTGLALDPWTLSVLMVRYNKLIFSAIVEMTQSVFIL